MISHAGNAQPNTHPSIDPPVLAKMLKVIIEVAQPEQVILFGSRAKGTAKDDSDYDFLIVDAQPFDKNRSRRQQISKISRALAPLRVPTDLLLHSTDEVKYWSHSLNHVIGRALREGSVVYERP
ncbi:MAG: nucleotidyltransferase domain-containing protein [Cyanobacteria bacterium J06555_13]